MFQRPASSFNAFVGISPSMLDTLMGLVPLASVIETTKRSLVGANADMVDQFLSDVRTNSYYLIQSAGKYQKGCDSIPHLIEKIVDVCGVTQIPTPVSRPLIEVASFLDGKVLFNATVGADLEKTKCIGGFLDAYATGYKTTKPSNILWVIGVVLAAALLLATAALLVASAVTAWRCIKRRQEARGGLTSNEMKTLESAFGPRK